MPKLQTTSKWTLTVEQSHRNSFTTNFSWNDESAYYCLNWKCYLSFSCFIFRWSLHSCNVFLLLLYSLLIDCDCSFSFLFLYFLEILTCFDANVTAVFTPIMPFYTWIYFWRKRDCCFHSHKDVLDSCTYFWCKRDCNCSDWH